MMTRSKRTSMARDATCVTWAGALTCAMALGCGVTRVDGDNGNGGGVPAEVQARFDTYCATPSCHNSPAVYPQLSPGASDAILDSMDQQGRIPLVDIGNPSNSYLAIKMVPELNMDLFAGSPMPVGGGMPPEDIAVILGWIAGAPFPDGETDGGTGTTGDPTDPTVASATGSGETTDTTDPSATATGTSGDEWMSVCSLMDVNPDAVSPVQAGDEAGLIPAAVGEAIENNCGCHLTSESSAPMYVINPFPVATLEDFLDDSTGQPRYQMALDRMNAPNSMPPAFPCEQDGQLMDPDEQALLIDWLSQGAPDGATYVPG